MTNSGVAKFQAAHDGDRISGLPDDLLCHILSFLPIKYAVATSILSTRWKFLFASLSSLDLDYPLFLPPGSGDDFRNTSFTNFVDRMLLLQKTPDISSFRLRCSYSYDIAYDTGRRVNAWVSAVLRRKVKELDLSVNIYSWMLPRILLRSQTLLVLKLCQRLYCSLCSGYYYRGLQCRYCNFFPVCLPSLRVMHLRSVEFYGCYGIRGLFSGCPMLEELKLFNVMIHQTGMLDISIPSLKSLTLYYDGDLTCAIRFNAPALEFFEHSNSHLADGQKLNLEFSSDSWIFRNILRSTCTLVVLKLCHWSDYGECDLPVCLPSLKVMHLRSVEFGSSLGRGRLFSRCPVLEELKLFNINVYETGELDISIPSLKSLTLCYDDDEVFSFEITLNAPNLEFFEYSDIHVADVYVVEDLKSVVNARLDVGLSNEQFKEEVSYDGFDMHMANCHAVAELVNEISSVKFLHLSGRTVEAIDRSNQCLPTFHNLTHLELGINIEYGWPLLLLFLECSPKLEVLVFVKGFMYYDGLESRYLYPLPEDVPMCLSLCLKEIEFQEFYGEEDELKLIEYFLKSGKVLKKITINMKSFVEWPSNICDQLFMFPKSSKTCQIVLAGLGK